LEPSGFGRFREVGKMTLFCEGFLKKLLVGCVAFLAAQGAMAADMSITWTDAAGDAGPVGDVVSAQLTFDSTGAWTATWQASAANPFTGNARFNLNLFDTALGNVNTAAAPQVSLDALHDFGTGTATFFSYSGTTPFLGMWHVGDVVSTGNGVTFLSGEVDMTPPYQRDNLLTQATITGAIPEPESYAMLVAGLALLGFKVRRKKPTIV
jgi:hypothetical protein